MIQYINSFLASWYIDFGKVDLPHSRSDMIGRRGVESRKNDRSHSKHGRAHLSTVY